MVEQPVCEAQFPRQPISNVFLDYCGEGHRVALSVASPRHRDPHLRLARPSRSPHQAAPKPSCFAQPVRLGSLTVIEDWGVAISRFFLDGESKIRGF